MRLIIESDYQKMSKWAAEHVIEKINAFGPTPEKPFVLGQNKIPRLENNRTIIEEMLEMNK